MYTSKRIKKSMIINNHKYTELHIKMHIIMYRIQSNINLQASPLMAQNTGIPSWEPGW